MATQKPPPFEKFDPKAENFESWKERFEMHLDSYEVDEEDKVKFLIACIGTEGYAVMKRLSSPKLPKDVSFADLVKLLDDYYNPKPLKDVCCFQFRNRKQHVGEKFAVYHAALKELSTGCEFGSRLEEELRSQIICGVNDDKLQKQLLTLSGSTYKKVVEVCVAFETAKGSYDTIHADNNAVPSASVSKLNEQVKKVNRKKAGKAYVNKSADNKSTKEIDVCFRCGRKNHRSPDCHFIKAVCNSCQRVGHLANVCGKSQAEIRAAAFQKRSRPAVNKQVASMPVVDIAKISVVSTSETDAEPPPPKIFIELLVDSSKARFEADCGADFTFMSLENCRKLNLTSKLKRAKRVFVSYNNGQIELYGIVPVKVTYNGKTLNLRLRIVDGQYDTILGRDWILDFGMDIREHVPAKINQTNSNSPNNAELLDQIMKLVDEFSDIFDENVGTVPDIEIDVPIDPNATPIFCKARPVPYALQEKVNAEIDRLIESGRYTPVMSSKWATPVVPVVKSNGSIRLVGDYSVTINPHCVPKNYPIPVVEEILTDFTGATCFSKFDFCDAYSHLKFSKAAAE